MSADPQRAQAWTRLLAARFDAAFPEALDGPRTIGREAEFPVVQPDGQAADIADLWAPLMARCPSLKAKREGDLIVAVDDAEADGWQNPDRLTTLRSSATPVSIREGEAKILELRRLGAR